MNFQGLGKIEDSNFYLDVAFRRASRRISQLKESIKGKDKLKKAKNLELIRLEIVKEVLTNDLRKILVSFPNTSHLSRFYIELMKVSMDYAMFKKSLGAVNWAKNKITEFFNIYKKRVKKISIKKREDLKTLNSLRREYYGRISSVVKQINRNLLYLEECRKILRSFPTLKTGIFTICISGFPNAGKSTLLKRLTGAEPEIKNYAFTTKKLNVGYMRFPAFKIQLIDTPGTLNRKNKMNSIELQAYLALKYLADAVIYVFDPLFYYPLSSQKSLLGRIRKLGKPILLYLSKTDIVGKDVIKSFKKEFPEIITSSELLREKIKHLINESSS